MKAKFGSIVVDGRGKIGGHVASKNRSGSYFRTKVTPVNPQTAAQSVVRSRFAVYASGWKALTQAQRDAWNAAVKDWQRTNIFGDLINPSGINLYQRVNNELVGSGATAITSPVAPEGVSTVQIGALTAESGTQSLSLVLSGPVPAGTRVKVFATAQLSAGKSYVKNELRQITTLAAAATTPVNLLAAYQAKFGDITQVGSKITVGIVFVDSSSGLASPMQITSDIVAASA